MFIDTNIFVRSRLRGAPGNEVARFRLERARQSGESVRISRQILREYLAAVTRPQPWQTGISREEALNDVNSLMENYQILEDSPAVTETLIRLCREVPVGGRQIHDANIVATMLAYGERRLFTFNTSDFSRYGERIDLV